MQPSAAERAEQQRIAEMQAAVRRQQERERAEAAAAVEAKRQAELRAERERVEAEERARRDKAAAAAAHAEAERIKALQEKIAEDLRRNQEAEAARQAAIREKRLCVTHRHRPCLLLDIGC